MPRIGVLMNLAADDKEGQARLIAFVQALSERGWKNTSKPVTPLACISARRSLLRTDRTSSWLRQLLQWTRYSTRHAAYRLCSHRCLIQWVPVMSQASHTQVVT